MARPSKARPAPRTASSRRAPAASAAAESEVVEDTGLSLADGLVIVTTLFLLLGLGTVDYFLGTRYDAGFLF